MGEQDASPKRVLAYVDGFNLYFGLKDSGWQRYYWLNIQKPAENRLIPSSSPRAASTIGQMPLSIGRTSTSVGVWVGCA